MMTLSRFGETFEMIPATTAWYLADLGESRGRQTLFIHQSPQRLGKLREHALIESAVSSNRIEGVEVHPNRVATLVFGTPFLQDRAEEEIRGYRQALKQIHEQPEKLRLSEETILALHRLTRGDIWDAGQYKDKEVDILEKHPNGWQEVRFKTVSAADAPLYLRRLVALYHRAMDEHRIPPLVLMAAFNLDFLCIHPFRDGNGRVSRLVLLLQCYHLGYEMGRYISLERLIEQNKNRYYETLKQSSEGWRNGLHNPWPYINFLLSVLKSACKEFEERLGETKAPRGAKTDIVRKAISNFPEEFTLGDLERACPGVSRDMVRRVLRDLQANGEVTCLGRGPGALWRNANKGITPEKG